MNHSQLIHHIIDIITLVDGDLKDMFQEYSLENFGLEKFSQSDKIQNMSFNSFLYEHHIGKDTTLGYVISEYKDEFDRDEMKYLKNINRNIYSLFEVLKVEKGIGMNLREVKSEKVYEVSENKATYDLEVGDLVFCRIANNGSDWIILYSDGKFPLEAGYTLKRNLRQSELELSTKIVAEFLHKQKNRNYDSNGNEINLEKYLRKTLKKYLGKKFKLKSLINEAANNLENLGKIIRGFLRTNSNKLPAEEVGKIGDALITYANQVCNENVKIGFLEEIITEQLFTEISNHFLEKQDNLNKVPKSEIDEFVQDWINKPQSELGKRTPREVVESERKSAGDNEPFQPDIIINTTELDDPYEVYSKKAIKYMKEGKTAEALEVLYKTAQAGVEHESVFFNIAACNFNLFYQSNYKNKKLLAEAKIWLEKAQEINPEHEKSIEMKEEIKRYEKGKSCVKRDFVNQQNLKKYKSIIL